MQRDRLLERDILLPFNQPQQSFQRGLHSFKHADAVMHTNGIATAVHQTLMKTLKINKSYSVSLKKQVQGLPLASL